MPPDGAHVEAAVRTFLIADVRGYTRFTQERGDEASAQLAGAFARLSREAVESCGGELIELRGDEALCVFGSARQALRAAVALQTRLRQRTDDGPAFPLPIGIGLDAGEAVPIEGGYRGGALNTAARLCALAGPGQILATDTVVRLARRLEGMRFVDRRPIRLKGLDDPVRVTEVIPETGLPPLPDVLAQVRPQVTRRTMALAAIAAVAILTGAVAFLAVHALGPDYLSGVEPNSVGVIDANGAGITSQVGLGSAPSALAVGGGFVWVASEADGTVSRIDPETRTVQRLTVGESAAGVSYGGGSVWVSMPSERAVAQIDPDTLRVVQRVPVGNGPAGVAAGAGAVWVANTFDGTVSRISLARGVVTDVIPVGARVAGIAVGAGAAWAADELNGIVLRIDPRSRRVVQAINVGNGPTSVAISEGQVWVANRQDGTVSRIDPDTNSVSATVEVGASPSSVSAGPGATWVASEGDGTVARIDDGTDRVARTLSLASSPGTLALSGGNLWVTTLPSLPSHRGGVLRVESDPSQCRCTDPAYFSEQLSLTDQNVLMLSYDGLVAYRRVGGLAGGTLVADLAVRLPTPTDAGRTYTFQLRRDLRYSNGALVRAMDVRHSLERVLTVNREYGLHFFEGIVGAHGCSAGKHARCDLSKGIEVDGGAGRITIHLTASDPDFLHKLAFPLALVVPARTPLRATRDIPGTGPYRVASFAPARAVRLVRDPYFKVWSPDARPDGYPDVIRFHLGDDSLASVAAVEKGTSDWTVVGGTVPSSRAQGLLTRHARRLHIDPGVFSSWLFLNTRAPPFHDRRVRRALYYALDRDAVRRFTGTAALRTRSSCQILTPGFPGYRPYCPYTLSRNPAETWIAPDPAKARALVAASGTRGTRIKVVIYETPSGFTVRLGRYLAALLRELGYPSSVRTFPDFGTYLEYVVDSRNRAQLGLWGWVAETLAPSSFFRQFSCGAFLPGTTANSNASEFCDRGVDAQMRRAAALQASDPARANELWGEVDRAIADRAAAVPLASVRNVVFVSERVGNYQAHPLWGTLLDQLWVR